MPPPGPRARVTRLFVAAWPDADTVRRLRELGRPDEAGVRWVPERNLHVTLRFLGEVDPSEVGRRLATADLPATRAVLGPEIERLGGQQIVVPVAGVDALAAAVRSATAEVGEHDSRPFRGHLTIARTRRGATSSLIGRALTSSFDVSEVALVASELLPTGAVYTTVATFPIGTASSATG
jgi:RNA 2',3'-cyclic 3'-phosphodiesterase